jgi:hypothetical protein
MRGVCDGAGLNTRNAEGDWKERQALVRPRRLICRCARDAEMERNNYEEGSVRLGYNFRRRSDSSVFTSDATDEDEESSDLEQSNATEAEKSWFVEAIVQVGQTRKDHV